MSSQVSPCQHCGARFPQGSACEEQFHISQIHEFEDPAYGAVHHLSVPSYMLQHNRYSRRGWLEVRALLHRFVFTGLTPQMARRELAISASSTNRDWSLTKGEKLAGVEQIDWSLTMANVRRDSAAHYCSDVTDWARAVLLDSERLVGTAT